MLTGILQEQQHNNMKDVRTESIVHTVVSCGRFVWLYNSRDKHTYTHAGKLTGSKEGRKAAGNNTHTDAHKPCFTAHLG
jgi:hypothetical protein